jgi:FtsP/CotA-like multicopper oxidase with cupredoxin domain
MKVKNFKPKHNLLALAVGLALAGSANAAVYVQCPGDGDGDSIIDGSSQETGVGYNFPANNRCKHLAAGDGFTLMGDGRRLYHFGFAEATGIPEADVVAQTQLKMEWPAPNIVVDEGDEYYLNLSNVAMIIRPDLFDPHTVHWHGFPNAASVFDGLPESAIAINANATLTYYYNVVEPGTYMYHCHVEATEHMQMGMLANLWVRPAQNRLPDGTVLGTHVHSNPDYNADRNLDDPTDGDKYVYNDLDGSTWYDVEVPLQLGGFDSAFHDASETVQPLPFAAMKDDYPMINGRGYPDTVKSDIDASLVIPVPERDDYQSQKISSKVVATAGDKVLLRLSNLNVVDFHTLHSQLPMTVVGRGARILNGGALAADDPATAMVEGTHLYYTTHSVTLGGGESIDLIIDTTGVTPGTYFLYAANFNQLSNNEEDYGGMMTELVVN